MTVLGEYYIYLKKVVKQLNRAGLLQCNKDRYKPTRVIKVLQELTEV